MALTRHVVLAVALYLLACVVSADICTDASGSVFVNEFHYDNNGTDTGEAIEVALPAGVDPSAISLVLYNGNVASSAVTYNSRSLSQATLTVVADGNWQLALLAYPTDGIQNGGNDGIAIVATCADASQKVLQFICYEGAATASNGPAAGQTCINIPVSEAVAPIAGSSLYLTGSGNKSADFTWASGTSGTNTYGAVNPGQIFTASSGGGNGSTPAPAPGPTPAPTPVPPPVPEVTCDSTNYTHAAAIQGSSTAVSSASPLSGTVSTIGVVVGTSFGTNSRRGFWISDPQPDSDPSTSDSVFVYVGSTSLPFTPLVKDRVLVTGAVSEFGSNTQIVLSQVTKCASDVSIDTLITELSNLPSEGNISAVLEPLEGSRVRITAQNLRVSENYVLGRYGEFWVSQGDLYTPTQLVSPGPAAIALENSQSYIRLDDGFTNQNPDPEIYPAPLLLPNNTLRTGYSVGSGFEAIVVQLSNNSSPYYDLVPVDPSSLTFDPSTSPRSLEAPARAPNTNLRVVATNVLNLFLGPPYPTSRGATNEAEFVRQVTKIVNGIASMKPDVFGVIEIANDDFGPTSTVANLTYLLNQKLGAGTYTYIDPGYPKMGSDAITCKILYQPSVVDPIGTLAVLNSSVDPTYNDIQRPTQAQSFMQKSTGANFTFVIAHLKSKGSSCATLPGFPDPDEGDGQGNCAGVRQAAAAAIVSWLAKNPTGVADPDILLMGDLNSYAKEDSITTLTSAGYTNLIKQFVGDSAYSFVFDGRRGYLDHALASPSMTSQVVGVAEWHINAAEPNVFDYNLEFKSANQDVVFYTPDPIRYSDHDPLIVDLKLAAPVVPVPEPKPLAAPTVTAVTSVKKGKVTVTMTDNSKDELAWRVQYATDAGFGDIVKGDKQKSSSGAGKGDSVEITTSGLKGGQTYYVRAFACSSNSGAPKNTSGCGPASDAVTIQLAK